MIRISGLDHVAIPVSDVERSILWYRKMFGLERRFEKEWGTNPAFLCAGGTCIALLANGIGLPETSPPTVRHFCFRTDEEGFVRALDELRKSGTHYSLDDHEVSRSLYFQDPDGHWIEVTVYLSGMEP